MRVSWSTQLIAMAMCSGVSLSAIAQTPANPPSAAQKKTLSDPTAAAILAPKAASSAAARCMRLPLSDIAVGRPETVAQAQLRLSEYAVVEAKRRGWKGTLAKSSETVQCEDYLYLPLIGQEYKCLVTATFCVK